MTAESLDWPMTALGMAEAAFDVLGPPELVDHLRERVDRFARALDRAAQAGGTG
jgi:hypothetical protein